MSITCDCSNTDYESPSIYNVKIVTAKKMHKCCECKESIIPKYKYENATSLWDGKFYTFKTCMRCVALRKKFCSNGFVHEELFEQLAECLNSNPLKNFNERHL